MRALPVGSWASRFRAGEAHVVGVADGGEVRVGGRIVAIGGPVRVSVRFGTPAGARTALVTELSITGALVVDGLGARSLAIGSAAILADGRLLDAPTELPSAELRLDQVLVAIVDHLADVSVEARAWADGELALRFAGGVDVSIPGGQVLAVQGATVGAPGALQLSAPLVVSVQGATLRLSHVQLRWISSLARVRVDRATLHPDGSVSLEGGARGGLDRAVRGGLQHASASLSRLVRSSPRFARVRAFLRPA